MATTDFKKAPLNRPNAIGTLDSGTHPTGISNSATSITLSSGDGAKFPSTADFWITFYEDDADTNEIAEVTANPSSDTFGTISRGQQGTSAAAWGALGETVNVGMLITRDQFTDLQTAVNNIEDGTTVLASVTTDGDIIANTGNTTIAIANTVATTINMGAAASSAINLGHASGTLTSLGIHNIGTSGTATTIKGTLNVDEAATFDTTLGVTGDTTLTGDLAVNGGDITTTASTLNVGTANATTVAAFTAASTSLGLGHASGTNTIAGATTFSEAMTITAANAFTIDNNNARMFWREADQTTDEKYWEISAQSKLFRLRAFNDAIGLSETVWTVTRGTAMDVTAQSWRISNTTAMDLDSNGDFRVRNDTQIDGTLDVDGNVTLGNASTDTITLTGRAQVRQVTDAGPMTATDGSVREIVYNTSDSKFYGCTTTGSPATWSALN